MRAVVPTVLAVALVLSACARQDATPSPPLEEGTAPPTSEEVAWTSHGVVELEVDDADYPALQAVENADAWDQAWERFGFEGALPLVDFTDHVVLLLGNADDACPDELIGLEVVDGSLEPEWLPPPGGCAEPLLRYLYAVEVHRGHLEESVTYALAEPFADVLAPATIELPAYDGAAPSEPEPPQSMSQEELDAVFEGHVIRRCTAAERPWQREAEVDGPLSDDQEIAEAQQGRAEFGVTSDEATVRELVENPPPSSGPEEMGFPLTAEESALHGEVSRTVDEVGAWIAAEGHAERVVPLFDRVDGLRPAVIVGEADGEWVRGELDREFGQGEITVHTVPWDPREAVAAQDAISEAMAEVPALNSVSFISGAPGPTTVGLIDPTREALDALAEAVDDPSVVCVEPNLSGVLLNEG